MTCTTCGSDTISADGECTLCDPWAVNPAQSGAKVQAAGLSATSEQLPKWMDKILATRLPPDVVEAARNRPQVVKYRTMLTVYMVLGLDFLAFTTIPTPSNYQFVAHFRLLALAPLVLVMVRRFRMKKRVKPVNWLVANVHYIRDSRPELGFRWIARMRELRISRAINMQVFPVFLLLMDVNLFFFPHNVGQTRLIFLVDGIAFILIGSISWYQATVLLVRAHSKVISRVAQ